MYLGSDGARRFFHIWLPLLRFVNERCKVVSEVPMENDPVRWTQRSALPIRERLWEEPTLVGEYIKERGRVLSVDDLRILAGWQHPVKGMFFIVKHLKNHSVFMLDERLYGVVGISGPISEMCPSTPIYVGAVLLPFEGKIIYDSLLMPYNVQLGPGVRKDIRDQYSSIKQQSGIVTTLSDKADLSPSPRG